MSIKSLVIFISALLFSSSEPARIGYVNPELEEYPVTDSTAIVTVSAVGDIMCHGTQLKYAYNVQDKSYDFNPVFSELGDFFRGRDLMLGNVETVFAGEKKGFKGYPVFNTPESLLDAIDSSGFDVIFTANNHAMDMNVEGLLRTYEEINKRSMIPIGTFNSQNDRDSVRVINSKGIKIAFVAYTYGTNGFDPPESKKFVVNVIDKELIENDLALADSLNPDLVLVYFHFGGEYKRYPNDFQNDIVKHTINNGADVILASHPHVMQPVDFYKSTSGRIDSGFVAYSMGNFVSNQRWRYSDAGSVINFSINKNFDKDSVYVSDVTYLPFWVFKGNISEHDKEFIVYPSEIVFNGDLPDIFTKNDSALMLESFYDNLEIMNAYTSKIQLMKLGFYKTDTISTAVAPLPDSVSYE